jgi:anti-sigma B factor antagonist
MEIDVWAADATATVRGDIDRVVSGHLKAVLWSLMDASDSSVVRLDLSDVSFIDSTGLGVLVGARRRGLDRRVEVVLRAPSARVWRLLEITGLTKIFAVEDRPAPAQ